MTFADQSKFFDAAQALSQSLSQWALLIIGGSLVVVVSNDYYRPPTRKWRIPYLLFVPAWTALAISAYDGIRAQGAYVGYLRVSGQGDVNPYVNSLNDYSLGQMTWMKWALIFLGIWLVFYICWWVFTKTPEGKEK